MNEDLGYELNKIMGFPSVLIEEGNTTDKNLAVYAIVPDNQGNACRVSSFKYINAKDDPDTINAAAKAANLDPQNIILKDHFNAPVVFQRPVQEVVCSAGRYQAYYLDRIKNS